MGGRVKGTRVLVVLSDEEREEVRTAAQAETLPVATFIRRAAVRAARQITAKAGKAPKR